MMLNLEVKVLDSKGKGKSEVAVKLDFTGEWPGLSLHKWGFSEEKYTDEDGRAYFSFDNDYDGAPFNLYVNHKREREYSLGKASCIEVNSYDDDDSWEEED